MCQKYGSVTQYYHQGWPVLTHRSCEKELLDLGPDYYSPTEFAHCQKMLFRINKLLGCFRETVSALKRIPKAQTLMDVGCGGGLFLLHLSRQLPGMRLLGVDISSEAIQLAEQERLRRGVATDRVAFELLPEPTLAYPANHVDVVLTTMVCHHMTNDEIVTFMQQAHRVARNQVIINDLHRHTVAYWFYWFLSPVLFRNRLITHDGLISIKRGFKRAEWERLIQRAGIQHYQIKWCFPFRWRVTLWKTLS